VPDQRRQDPKDTIRTSVTADGVKVQVETAAHAPAQSQPAPGRVETPPQPSPLRAVLGRARRAGTAFAPSPHRPGDGDSTVEPPGRMPRSMRAGALIAGLVLVAGAFVMSSLHQPDHKPKRETNPAAGLVGDPNNGDAGAVPGAVPAPLTSSAFASALPSLTPGTDQTAAISHGGGGGAGAGAGALGAPGKTPRPGTAPVVPAPPPTHAPNTVRIVGWRKLCIDVPDFHGVDGQRLQVAYCNGMSAQDWTFPGDGTIRIYGLCMDVAWGSRDNGAAIQIAYCSGNPAQQFVLTGAGDLVNPQSNKCVDVTGWGGDRTPLQQWDCDGGGNQKWWRA
jgi:hypothetical protein